MIDLDLFPIRKPFALEDLLGAALNLEIEQCYLDVHYRSRSAELIEFSLGAPSAFVFGHQKSRFVELARAEGLAVPRTAVVPRVSDLLSLLAKSAFPVVLKRDDSFGGQGVRYADVVAFNRRQRAPAEPQP